MITVRITLFRVLTTLLRTTHEPPSSPGSQLLSTWQRRPVLTSPGLPYSLALPGRPPKP